MFGCYSVINIVVLLNLLIAMMNHSYQLISVSHKPHLKREWLSTQCKQFGQPLEFTC